MAPQEAKVEETERQNLARPLIRTTELETAFFQKHAVTSLAAYPGREARGSFGRQRHG